MGREGQRLYRPMAGTVMKARVRARLGVPFSMAQVRKGTPFCQALFSEKKKFYSSFSQVILKLSSNEMSFRRERLYVNKLNIILVQILKHERPARWRSFIPDLVEAAKISETICENYMAILKLLSEEIFDFSKGEMTQQKIKELKQSLNSDFQLIHELCLYVLSASQRAELIRATLATLSFPGFL